MASNMVERCEKRGREVYIAIPLLNVLLVPKHWPRWARRLFVITLPASGPILLALWLILFIGILLAASVGGPVAWVWAWSEELWRDAPGEIDAEHQESSHVR